jgi:hypothetical protein
MSKLTATELHEWMAFYQLENEDRDAVVEEEKAKLKAEAAKTT